ncbi:MULTISPECIES: HdeD family acid-resistance protein [unclassified Adlercreutzia]|uniref:HdeD family acid-resistance protein n=1 Tax=unclassified Adlercreutzia TaxID=2636013 RepID=UPI0013EA0544|nr:MULTISPECIES: DUF308 domain-containing protein [unclassified Adlercreutzia]
MSPKAHKKEKSAPRHDWGMVFGGVMVFIAGFVLMLWPGLTLVSIATAAGLLLLAVGIYDVIAYFRTRKSAGVSGWVMVNAVCDIILGLLFVTHPLITAEVIPMFMGVFVCVYGVFAIVAAIRLRKVGFGWGFMLANGIVALLCGLSFILVPESFVIFLGLFLAMRGVTMAVFGFMEPRAVPFI